MNYMKKIIVLVLLLNINCYSPEGLTDFDSRLELNKNFIFCNCINSVNRRYGLEIKDKENKKARDGSIEVYFINKDLTVDLDSVSQFVKLYLDSLEINKLYNSYNNNSLGIAKCLDLYNSKKVEDFVRESFRN